jgi:prepilin-type N-terminal cleavage/methylation domain-containing protein/prepilin-type processing-associated H-X9-DG protein
MDSRTPRGFTLIELLVVMAIIAILAAILFPVFVQAKVAANRAVCLSNMKGIGTSLTLYENDFDDMTPIYQDGVANFNEPAAAPNFLGSLTPYSRQREQKGIYACPLATKDPLNPCARKSCTSYLGNGVVLGKPSATAPEPANTVYLQEFLHQTNYAYARPYWNGSGWISWHYNTTGKEATERYSAIHDKAGNVLFMDSHAKFRELRTMRSGMFGLSPDLSSSAATGQRYAQTF